MERNANQVADKSDRDCSEGKTTHLAAFVMTAMRVCMQRAAKASSTEGARQSDGMRRKHLQIECFSVHVHCKILKNGANDKVGVHMHQVVYHAENLTKMMFRAANTADHKPLRAGCPSPRSVFFGATLLQQSLRHTGSPRVICFLTKPLHPSRARYLYPTSSFGWTCPSAVSRVPQLQKMVGGAAPDARPPVG